jgi:hypothetical protein
MVNYQNGKIYKLVNNNDDDIYIGATCSTLTKRKYGHKKDAGLHPDRRIYAHLNQVGWENVSIILIETCPCNNRNELSKRERYWVDKLKPVLNTALPLRNKREYYIANKEKIIARSKKYREDNPERIRLSKQKWRDANKDLIKAQHGRWSEQNKERIQKKKREYYLANREKIIAQSKKNKEARKQRLLL